MTLATPGTAQPANLAEIVQDQAAFRAWYDASLPRVYRYLLSRCDHDVALAEELTQQTFVEAIHRRRQFDGRSEIVTWLIAIGRNKLVDHYRRLDRDRRRHLKLVSGWPDASETPWRTSEDRAEVAEALGHLTGEQRVVLMLRYFDAMPVREIARLIGRSESAAESLLFRAREAFRRAYRGQTDA